MAKIFITRTVDVADWQEKLGGSHQVVGKSLLSFSAVPFELPEAEWIFFYSATGVEYFFKQSHAQLAPYKWAAIGEKTAAVLSEYVLDVDFVGNGEPHATAQQFMEQVASYEQVCFAQAKNSRASVQKLLPTLRSFSITVYDNQPIETIPTADFDIVICTSPLNAEVYYSKRKQQSEQVLAIGAVTAQKLSELGVQDVVIAPEPYEEVLLEMVKRMLLKR